jgi:hypothetical protein
MKIQKLVSLDLEVRQFVDEHMPNFNFSEWVNESFKEQFMDADNIQKRILINKKMLKKVLKTDTSFINELKKDFEKYNILDRISKANDPKAVYRSFLSSTGREGSELSYKKFAETLLKLQKCVKSNVKM